MSEIIDGVLGGIAIVSIVWSITSIVRYKAYLHAFYLLETLEIQQRKELGFEVERRDLKC